MGIQALACRGVELDDEAVAVALELLDEVRRVLDVEVDVLFELQTSRGPLGARAIKRSWNFDGVVEKKISALVLADLLMEKPFDPGVRRGLAFVMPAAV